jgi:AcrR family transcriptional regulator
MELNEKQEHILAIALQLFGEQGFSATSIRDIAQKANINVSMISYYFGGKEGLLKAIVQSKVDAMKIRIGGIISNDALTVNEKIDILIEESVIKFWQNRVLNNIITREHNFNLNTELKEVLHQLKNSRYEQLHLIIQQGQELGVFKKDVNVPLMQATITGVLKHIYFSDDYYFNLLGISDKENKDDLLLEHIKNYIKTVFKLILNETNTNKN